MEGTERHPSKELERPASRPEGKPDPLRHMKAKQTVGLRRTRAFPGGACQKVKETETEDRAHCQ